MKLPPRSRTACRSLPPGGAAAPAARQSRFRGPGLQVRVLRSLAWRRLVPGGSGLAWGGPALRPLAPPSLASRNSLPPEGAAAPAARQSRFRGPGLHGRVLRTLNAGSSPCLRFLP
ncbi:MAG: hypothetical protein B7X59_15360 [Polaromonas sp. 39-63-203]|nr:MAG: hypothetical protein B7X59_15360 [Polaromonas sp. 39-63-203]